MFGAILAGVAVLVLSASAFSQSDETVLTLYRNSALEVTMRIHIATFDSVDGKDYNAENCAVAADLFGGQDGVSVRFLCEPGQYRP